MACSSLVCPRARGDTVGESLRVALLVAVPERDAHRPLAVLVGTRLVLVRRAPRLRWRLPWLPGLGLRGFEPLGMGGFEPGDLRAGPAALAFAGLGDLRALPVPLGGAGPGGGRGADPALVRGLPRFEPGLRPAGVRQRVAVGLAAPRA